MPLYVRTILVSGPPDEVDEARSRHLEHLRELKDEGRLRIAGELAEGEGFVEIYEAADRLEGERVGRSSPLLEEGLGSFMIREWRELLP